MFLSDIFLSDILVPDILLAKGKTSADRKVFSQLYHLVKVNYNIVIAELFVLSYKQTCPCL